MPSGQIFGYQNLPNYTQAPTAVIKALGRMVSQNKVERLSKGKFYVSKEGLLGALKPSDNELLRSVLYKNDRLYGYLTGMALYNRLGLTTQVPSTITVAYNGGSQEKNFGTFRVRTVITRVPIEEKNVKLLQYLDVLKSIKKIPDHDINASLKKMQKYISELSGAEQKGLLSLALNYYGPQVRALLGLIFSSLNKPIPTRLKQSLNPTTIYKLNLTQSMWPMATEWNIQ